MSSRSRLSCCLLLLASAVACGPKAPPPEPAAPAALAPAPEPEAEPIPESEPEPAPDVTNATFSATVKRADGTSTSGKLKRVERSTDWFGEEGWSTDSKEVTLTIENANGERQAKWEEVRTIVVKPGSTTTDVDCIYDSKWSPWMYDCTLKMTGSVALSDGSKWTVADRHKWRFTYGDGTQVEFWLFKHSARQQDDKAVELGSETAENFELYSQLQERLRQEVKTALVTGVTVTP